MKNVLAIRRADQFSPNSVEKDRAILMAVVEKLEQPVRVMDEDEYVLQPISADLIISMARRKETLQLLAQQEELGTRVINSAKSLISASRSQLQQAMRELGVALPATMGDHGYWLKRGDMAAQSEHDVVFCKDAAELASAEANFVLNGITDWVVQAHEQGDLVKWYAVGDGFFKYYYPADDGNFKFADEKRNGAARHYPFDAEALHKEVAMVARYMNIQVYGGDAIVREDGSFCIIDFNDWPSFSRCANEAAEAIAKIISYDKV